MTADDCADNQDHPDTFLATSRFLPHFADTVAARYVRPGGPFDPHGGACCLCSPMADQACKRLGRLRPAGRRPPKLSFWISYDIETDKTNGLNIGQQLCYGYRQILTVRDRRIGR